MIYLEFSYLYTMEVNEPALAQHKRYFTIEDYLTFENASEEKHEYYQGEILAMSGAKNQHNIITGNLFANLWNKLRGKPWALWQRPAGACRTKYLYCLPGYFGGMRKTGNARK